uniref:Integrase, catalytic region, zinc finger, CCHC-type, peptidase aspartic, catalytic n=1 Tax=Tanacetum cinerariifolium TaxID=118510 RepID=A0A6L2M707_TANCI|nr:integrase, catalytic region, zinc finger, CCHC-type, peptidase aspartic, catalytic [Tanacetum cinerariifolium]
MELVLEQTQQGSSHEVSIRIEGVKELKRIVRIKGVKKEAFHTTLGRNRVNANLSDLILGAGNPVKEVLLKLNLPAHRLREAAHPHHPFSASLIWMEKVDWMSWKVELLVAGRGKDGKGGSYVLIPDLLVMTKVGASGSGVLLLLIAKRIWEYYSRNPLRCWTSMSLIPFGKRAKTELGELIELPTVDPRYVVVKDLNQKPFVTDFSSWQQRIRLYYRGKENVVNILKSINEGPFQMGTFQETLAKGNEGAFHLGPERPRVYSDLSPKEKGRGQGNNAQGAGAAGYRGAQNKVGNVNPGQARVALDEEHLMFIAGGQDNDVDEDVDEQPVQDLALNVDNVFQVDDCDAFDSDVDEAPTAQIMFMENLSSADHVYDEASPSYDSNILSEVPDHDNYQDVVREHHEYVKDNAVSVVQSNLSSVPNDAYMLIINEIHEPSALSVSANRKHKVVNTSLTIKLATYKEQVELVREKKVKIAPHNYSKENYLATFTPQKQLTPEQIFWSNDLLKMKAEALKEQTTALRPIKVLTVYPPNTPATLVPRRIRPTGLTEGERDFEQTKECYLTEVIPFFKTLKDHFEDIQKVLTKQIKEMKEIFEELEAEVDQNVVNRKHDEIEQKNLLIANDNLIVDYLSKDVFYTATDYMLTASSFSNMHEAFNAAQKRIADLESENSHLKNKTQNDDHDVQSIGNTIHKLREKISGLTKKHSDADPIHDLKALDSQNKELHAKVNALHDLNERRRAENKKVKRHYKKLYDLIKITCAKTIDKTNSLLTEDANLKAQIKENHKSNCVTMPAVKSKVLAPGMVKGVTVASESKPKSNTKKDKTLLAKSDMKKVEVHPRNNKSSVKRKNRVDSSISYKRTVVQIVLWYLDLGCLKHMMGDRSRLRNFVKRFIGIVRFGNDHFGAIMGYEDYVIGDSVISRVYYVEGLGHNLFFVKQFCDSDLEVAFRKHSCYVRDTDDVKLIKGSRGSNLYTILVEDMMKSSPICLLSKASKNKSWLWHRHLNHLNFATINDLAQKD